MIKPRGPKGALGESENSMGYARYKLEDDDRYKTAGDKTALVGPQERL